MQIGVDVRFCSLCDESVPQAEFEDGRAIERNGRAVCASCNRSLGGARKTRTLASAASFPLGATPRPVTPIRARRSAPAPKSLSLIAIAMSQLLVFGVFAVVVAVVLVAIRQRWGWSVDGFLDQFIQRLT